MEEATKTPETPETPVTAEQPTPASDAPAETGKQPETAPDAPAETGKPDTPATPENDGKKPEPRPLTDEEIQSAIGMIQSVDCTLEFTVGEGEAAKTETKTVRFNTPLLTKIVKNAPDGATIRITCVNPGEKEPHEVLKAGKADAIKALEASTVPTNMVAYELRKYVQFLIDHSDLRGAGFHCVCGPNDGKYLGFGFVAVAPDVTAEEGMLLVNAGDANIDEYIARSKLEVPGRSARPKIVTPTDEEVKKLG